MGLTPNSLPAFLRNDLQHSRCPGPRVAPTQHRAVENHTALQRLANRTEVETTAQRRWLELATRAQLNQLSAKTKISTFVIGFKQDPESEGNILNVQGTKLLSTGRTRKIQLTWDGTLDTTTNMTQGLELSDKTVKQLVLKKRQ